MYLESCQIDNKPLFCVSHILLLPFLILLTCTKSIFTNFYGFPATFTKILLLLCNFYPTFYQLFTLFTTFQKLLLPSFLYTNIFYQLLNHQSHHATGISSLFMFLLHALHCLYQLHQVTTLISIIVSGSSSSKWLFSRLRLLRST